MTKKKILPQLTVGELRLRLARYDPSLEVWLEVDGHEGPATITARSKRIQPPGPDHVVIQSLKEMLFIEIPEKWQADDGEEACGEG